MKSPQRGFYEWQKRLKKWEDADNEIRCRDHKMPFRVTAVELPICRAIDGVILTESFNMTNCGQKLPKTTDESRAF